MTRVLLIAAVVLHLSLGAPNGACPEYCTCQVKKGEASCTSYELFKKLPPKHLTIVRLNINDASLVKIDSKLERFKNLNTLDLSRNKIVALPSRFPYLPKLQLLNLSSNYLSDVAFAQLPENLKAVDLSNNIIRTLSKEWLSLSHLTTLHYHDNPIQCDCDNLLIYEDLVKAGVLSEELICYEPREFRGKLITSVNCSGLRENLLDSMLGDEPGSGYEEETQEEHTDLIENGFINASSDKHNHEEEEEEEEIEGSAEGSGAFNIPTACHFNCSTPAPVGKNDEKDASSPPDGKEQLFMVINDIKDVFAPLETQPPVAQTEDVTPETVIKEEPTVEKESDKSQVETFPTNDTVAGEMERTRVEEASNRQSVYIVVGLLIAFAAFLLIYFLNKRRNQKKRMPIKRNKSESAFGEEMKPLGNRAEVPNLVEPINSKPPESLPLLNGKNGKMYDADNQKTGSFEENELVELRKSDKRELLTSQLERVTIKEAELPDSIPKTPMLVERKVNSDGEIITTAVNAN